LRQVAEEIGQRSLDEIPFTIVLTVPAIWKPYTRSRMFAAAKLAGLLDSRRAGETLFHFISEPEAATLATLHDMQASNVQVRLILSDINVKQTLTLGQAGDTLTVVDVGGGTVDLISYLITDVGRFTVSEVVEGKGGLCGATFVDQAFLETLEKEIGEVAWNQIPYDELVQLVDSQWETGFKRQFVPGRSFNLRLTGSFYEALGKANLALSKLVMWTHHGEFRLICNREQMQAIFDSVVPQIVDLVQQQVQGVKDETGAPPRVRIKSWMPFFRPWRITRRLISD
jgi:hypothetical protein